MTGERGPGAPLWSSRVNLDRGLRRIRGGLDLRSQSGQSNHGLRAGNSMASEFVSGLSSFLNKATAVRAASEAVQCIPNPKQLGCWRFLHRSGEEQRPSLRFGKKSR